MLSVNALRAIYPELSRCIAVTNMGATLGVTWHLCWLFAWQYIYRMLAGTGRSLKYSHATHLKGLI